MVRAAASLTTALLLLAAAVLPRAAIFSAQPRGAENAPAVVASAVELLARPPGAPLASAVGDDTPLLSPALVGLVYHVALRLEGRHRPGDRYRFKTAFEEGSGRAVALARWTWFALTVLAMGLSYRAARSLSARRGRSASWSGLVAPLLVALSPLALSAAVRVDPALPVSVLVLAALSLLLGPSHPRDVWRWIAAGGLLGVAAVGHEEALIVLAVLLCVLARYRGQEFGVRLLAALVAVAMGALVGEPRIVDHPALLWQRFADHGLGAAIAGGAWTGAHLWRGLTAGPIAFALLGSIALLNARGRERWIGAALLVPIALALALPVSDPSTALLVLPSFLLVIAVGAQTLRARSSGVVATAATAAALALLPGWSTAHAVARSLRGDSRVAAAAWLRENLTPGARVVSDFYGPEIPDGHVSFLLPFNARQPRVYAGAYLSGWYEGFDTFILVSTQYERYEREPEAYQQQLAFIAMLRRHCELAARFDSGRYLGPTIEILTRARSPSGTGLQALLARPRIDPAVTDFYLSLGAAYQEMGDRQTALGLYQVARRLTPEDPRVAVNLANLFLEADQDTEADAVLTEAVGRNPEFAMLRLQNGILNQKRGLWNSAIGEYKMAVRYNPMLVDAHMNLAVCYLQAGNPGGAAASFRRVVELAPTGERADEARRMLAELGQP